MKHIKSCEYGRTIMGCICPTHNVAAFDMIEGRFSESVKAFNHYDVSETDSDAHFWAVKTRINLAKAALERAPEIKVISLPRSLGDIYRAVEKNLTDEERASYHRLRDEIDELMDKYDM